MSKSHSHEAHEQASPGSPKVAFFLNLRFTIIESIGGLWTNSIATIEREPKGEECP